MPSADDAVERDADRVPVGVPTVEQLDRELSEHAAVANAAIAAEQARAAGLEEQLETAAHEIETLTSDLSAVREHLRQARAEVEWLRRAGISLNAVMEHPAALAARRAGRAVARLRRSPVDR